MALELQVFPMTTDPDTGEERITGSSQNTQERIDSYSVLLRDVDHEDSDTREILDVSVCSEQDARELCDFIESAYKGLGVAIDTDWQLVELNG